MAATDRGRPLIPRVDVLGVGISAIDMDEALDEIARWITAGEQHYVCVTGVHGVMESQRDPELRRIHNDSGLTTPDGMPMVWAGHRAGGRGHATGLRARPHARRVRAGRRPRLDLVLLWRPGGRAGDPRSAPDGALPGPDDRGHVLAAVPALDRDGGRDLVERIDAAAPDLVWVGLSTPKQERWMAPMRAGVDAPVLVVSAPPSTSTPARSPRRRRGCSGHGLEWVYRVLREPRRLWRRYASMIPRFVIAIVRRPPRLLTLPESAADQRG